MQATVLSSLPLGQRIESGGRWTRTSCERGAHRLVRHRIYGRNGDLLHEDFCPYAKFGAT